MDMLPVPDAIIDETRRKVLEMEEVIRKVSADYKLDIPVHHHFSHGVYARQIIIPKGALVTGEIHKYENMNYVFGDIMVLVDSMVARLKGFHMITSPAGIKRIAYAIEDTVWFTVLPTDERNPDVIRKLFTASTEEEYQQFLSLVHAEPHKWLS